MPQLFIQPTVHGEEKIILKSVFSAATAVNIKYVFEDSKN